MSGQAGHITYGFYDTDFGRMVLGRSEAGLCWLGFMEDGDPARGFKGDGESRMRAYFPKAEFTRDDGAGAMLAQDALKAWAQGSEARFPIDLHGTTFQKSVWAALLNIKRGSVKTYSSVAHDIGRPKASRAVGSAVGANPISLIVPCHRVVPAAGGVGSYGWGPAIKRALLDAEAV